MIRRGAFARMEEKRRAMAIEFSRKDTMKWLKSQVQTFKTNLEDFARIYKKEIRKNPQFRIYFQKMCGNIGVDPLASNKGFWAELLGVGDFYYELAIQIIDLCLSKRDRNGGLVELGELKRNLEKIRGSGGQEISEDDIVRSIKTLKPLGGGFEVIQIGERKMVRSVPHEFSTDQAALLELAQTQSFVTKEMVIIEKGWSKERVDDAIENLLSQGLCWVDYQSETAEYWIPSFFDGLND
ncbi:7421_t:CDS:2 [Paraglomus brasilianum]|uniref:Vacuolar-sorting protein SNF8 n=1 Tax=Paraglomus brasilianum TaxID=144538 RepID=A0A9N8ZCY3_9GLOM|nr:7421_t:CDS:2 [Paraglomus brasilianum]